MKSHLAVEKETGTSFLPLELETPEVFSVIFTMLQHLVMAHSHLCDFCHIKARYVLLQHYIYIVGIW